MKTEILPINVADSVKPQYIVLIDGNLMCYEQAGVKKTRHFPTKQSAIDAIRAIEVQIDNVVDWLK